jgi:hypothetical protein
VPQPKVLVFGLDQTWCSPSADRDRLTFRAFPAWLYEEHPLRHAYELLSLRSVETAGRVVLNWLGLMPDRIRADGYEVFVPDDARYDLARARSHTALLARARPSNGEAPLSEAERAELRMPALDWLERILALPETRKILIFPPVHVSVQPSAGSRAEGEETECKRRITEIARRTGSALLDFRLRSAVTTDDSNYWDPLHYRIGIALRLAMALDDGARGGHEPADGFYRVLYAPDSSRR